MNLLFDTHAFIWWDAAPEKLSLLAAEALGSTGNMLFLSVASLWKIQIKAQLGKIELATPLHEIVAAQENINGVSVIPVQPPDIYALDRLPHYHKDPFDRLLASQAIVGNYHLISHDSAFRQYPVSLIW